MSDPSRAQSAQRRIREREQQRHARNLERIRQVADAAQR